VRRAAEPFPACSLKTKRFSFTVHYRLAPSAEWQVRNIVKQVVDLTPIAVDMMDAHYAIEIKSPCFSTKAARSHVSRHLNVSRAYGCFVGDDTTDESGFALVSARGGSAYSAGRRRPGAIGSFSTPSSSARVAR
jgi:trehalose 6-phosphate phosphatase